MPGVSLSVPDLTTDDKKLWNSGFPPGITVDELCLYRKKRPPGSHDFICFSLSISLLVLFIFFECAVHLRKEDHLKIEEGSYKSIKSEYQKKFKNYFAYGGSCGDLPSGRESQVGKLIVFAMQFILRLFG